MLVYVAAAAVLVVLAYLAICGLALVMWMGEWLFDLFRKQEDEADGIRDEDS